MELYTQLEKGYRPTVAKVQRFGHWVWVLRRQCTTCGHSIYVCAGDTRRRPQLGRGGTDCPACGAVIIL